MTEQTEYRTAIRGIGADGETVWPRIPEPPSIEPFDEPQVFTEVPADAVFSTTEGRLMAEGWAVPRPDIHEVLASREALRSVLRTRIAPRATQDPTITGSAVRIADGPAIEEGIIRNALDWWLTHNLGTPDSDLSRWSYDLELRWTALLHRHHRSVLRSLIGRDSRAANALRARAEGMASLVTPPEVSRIAYVINR